ncbi:repulsive guidance molecule A isoform X2 [Aplysia californica]|uniref:Repulsive guidance molecule A isoform X2 n=1 Tax=Aplysia californica TaxID=6500 RepID=A0ABM0JZR3_APLCA|nr:repulsive guidance molecule A isoform X2 [Aplysia californica]
MDYLNALALREKASQSSRAAKGPPSLAAWKGMGPCGYHKPRSLATISIGYLLILLGALFMSVESFPQGEDCHVERCSDEYESARQDLGIDGPGPHDNTLMCTVLRTYRHCMITTPGCQGEISYYSLRSIVRRLMDEHNCTTVGQTVEPSETKPRPPMVPAICLYKGKPVYRHCSLFGDPHIRTFYEEAQTCKVKGAWPLVNNDYLIVQVTNDPVEGNTDATATSKLTVIVKGNPECTSANFQTYQAQSNSLPGTFENGHVTYGPYGSLELIEVEPGRHVEIHIRYIETVVIVRQIGRYFTFSIKMPEELVNKTAGLPGDVSNDLDLCVRGCPLSEQINYQEYLAKRRFARPSQTRTSVSSSSSSSSSLSDSSDAKYSSDGNSPGEPLVSRAYAEKVCRASKLVDFYFDSCVFDLMATGDENFTLSALSSLQDVVKFHPSAARTMDNRTTLDLYDKQYGNGASGLLWSSSQRCGYCRTGVCFGCQRQQWTLFLLCLTLLITAVCSR